MPFLSIILPVCNGSAFVEKCIDSILTNTFADFELIIINDGSTDTTAEISNRYAAQDKRVAVYHNSNHGVSYSRNFGIGVAKGTWIGFVDADDWLTCDAFATIVANIRADISEIVCYGFWSVTKDNECEVKLPSMGQGKISFIREQMLHGWTVVWNSFFKKDFLDSRALRFKEEITIGEDFELLIRAYSHADNIVVINKPLYYYNRMNEESALHKMTVKHYDEIIGACLSIIEFFKDNGVINEFSDIVAWKVLQAKQDYVLDPATHKKFLSIYPESHRYILNCPIINWKIKIMMWLLTHHMGLVTKLITNLRKNIKHII